MHGTNDTIVPPTYLLEAKEYLVKHGLKAKYFSLRRQLAEIDGSLVIIDQSLKNQNWKAINDTIHKIKGITR